MTSIPVEEHTNRSASFRSNFRWKPPRKITSHALTRADLWSGVEIHSPVRGDACNTVFTRASSSKCVYRRHIHSMCPVVAGKALLFHFFSPTTVTAFFCRLNLHCFCVCWSSMTFSRPWELYPLIPTDFSSLWLKKTSLWLKKVGLLILLYLELL